MRGGWKEGRLDEVKNIPPGLNAVPILAIIEGTRRNLIIYSVSVGRRREEMEGKGRQGD